MPIKWRYLLLGLALAGITAGALLLAWQRTSASSLLLEGRRLLDTGEVEKAEGFAQKLEKNGAAAETRVLRAAIWLHQGRKLLEQFESARSFKDRQQFHARSQQAFSLALTEVSRARAEDPLAIEAALIGAECLIRLGEHRLPAEALQAVVRRQPDQREAHRLLAAIYMDTGAREQAIRHHREWARLDPADGRPLRWIGFYFKGENKPGEAAEAYDQALKRNLVAGVRAEVVKEWAEVLMEGQAAFAQALEVLERCPAELAGTPELGALRAECLWGLGRTAEAIEHADAVLKETPEQLRALSLRARIHLAQEQLEAAAAVLEKALESDPHDLGNRQRLAETYQRLGQADRAEEHRQKLEQSREYKTQLTGLHGEATKRPWDDGVRVEIAELCLKVNRPAEARMWLQASLAVNRRNAQALTLLERLMTPEAKPLTPAPQKP
jgi:tetratricopeptide (TPR) repeat protein